LRGGEFFLKTHFAASNGIFKKCREPAMGCGAAHGGHFQKRVWKNSPRSQTFETRNAILSVPKIICGNNTQRQIA
jgi:hypothetical protein